jgi:hypothetical protein
MSIPSVAVVTPVEFFALISKVDRGSFELIPIWAKTNPEKRNPHKIIILFFILF